MIKFKRGEWKEIALLKDRGRWKIAELCGRLVAIRLIKKTDKERECADCKNPAKLIVCELESGWSYCGTCESG